MIDRIVPLTAKGLVKICLPLKPGEWEDLEAENVWAEDVGTAQYRIANVPFYFYGVSAEDIVSATIIDGLLTFTGVVSRGGHSTYRLLLPDDITIKHRRFVAYWKRLERMGCTFELANRIWLAVDVPPETDIDKVCVVLEDGEKNGAWSYFDGHCGHLPGGGKIV
jgi:hypothetical protein